MTTKLYQIEDKINKIKHYLDILIKFQKYSLEQITKNVLLKGAVERYLYLATDSVISLIEMVVSFKSLQKPMYYSDSVDILSENGIISNNQQKLLHKIIGFRNIMAHDYEKVDYQIVYSILQNNLTDISEFCDYIIKKL